MGLTFEGLLWYFRKSGDPKHTANRINFFFGRYQEPYDAARSKHRKNRLIVEGFKELIPFCPLWSRLIKHIGGKYLEILEMTVNNFYVDEQTSFRIEPLLLNVETFPNYSGECTDSPIFLERSERDPLVVDYLKSEEAALLKEAYIAYLLNEDFNLLGQMDTANQIKQNLPELKSAKEYAFFENEEKTCEHLFSKEGLAKFFPIYSGIEYYFTGMFMKNLLWNEKHTKD